MEYKIPYGKGEQVVSLPEEHVSQVLLPPVIDKPQTVAKLMEEALAHPIGTPTLEQLVKPGEKVVLLVSDITRAWARFDLFLPILVARLNQIGVPDADISIIIATGKHRLNSAAEKEEIIGNELFHRIKVYDHNPATEACVYLGTTKRGTPVWINKQAAAADKVILTGGLSPHIYAGFGGGRKSVLPGIAGAESINHNHNLALTDEIGGGVNPDTSIMRHFGNRLSEDMCEVASFLNPCFMVNAIMDAEGNFFKIMAGHWYEAWLQGTKEVMKLQGVPLKEKSDVVIVSGGGYPRDISLYQGMKCYARRRVSQGYQFISGNEMLCAGGGRVKGRRHPDCRIALSGYDGAARLFRKFPLYRPEADGTGCAGGLYGSVLCCVLYVLSGTAFHDYPGNGAGEFCQWQNGLHDQHHALWRRHASGFGRKRIKK